MRSLAAQDVAEVVDRILVARVEVGIGVIEQGQYEVEKTRVDGDEEAVREGVDDGHVVGCYVVKLAGVAGLVCGEDGAGGGGDVTLHWSAPWWRGRRGVRRRPQVAPR